MINKTGFYLICKIFLSLTIALLFSLFVTIGLVKALGSPVKISNSSTNDVVFPHINSDNNGYLHVVWQEVTPGQSWSGEVQNPGIFYSRWNGDTWSTPLLLSSNTLFAENPSVTSDSLNTTHVVWDESSSATDWTVKYKTRSSGGTWSSIETLPLAAGTNTDWAPVVAVDNLNIPYVVFTGTQVSPSSVYLTKKVLGLWTTPELMSLNSSLQTITDSQWSDLKADSSGNLHLAYWSYNQGIFYRKYNGVSWTDPFQLNPVGGFYPRIAVTPAGEVFVTWLEGGTDVNVRWTQSGTWQTETTLTTLGTNSFWGYPIMGITTDSKERAHVGWGERDAGNLIDLRYKTFQSGVWSAARDVDLDNNDADSPFVFRDKWDNQHFVWTEYNPSNTRWELMYRVAEGTIQTLGTAGGLITANPNNTTYVTLDLPANALTQDTEISIQIGPVPESVSPSQVTIPRAFTFRPHGLVFANNKTATANIFYTDLEVTGVDERQLKTWLWDSSTNTWQARSTRNTPSQNKIAADLTGFSLYGISGPVVSVNWLKPLPDEVIKQAALLFEFGLNYADGTEVLLPQSPDELTVKLINNNGQTVLTYQYESSQLVRDEGKGVYKESLQFQKEDVPNGNYKLEIYLAGNLVGSQNFSLDR